MGIYGYGKAFNLRYAHNTYKPSIRYGKGIKQPIISSHTVTSTTNINIKRSDGNFWTGLFSGLFGGLLGGGMFFGNSMFGGMGTFMPASPFGMLNTQMPQPQLQQKPQTDELGNLQKMYSKYTVLPNSNGTYTLTTGKGDNVKTGTYEELIKGFEEPQGTTTGTTGETTTTTTGATTTTQNTSTTNTQTGGKIHVADGWYRADTQSNEGKNLQLNKCTSANAVLEKLLSAKMDYLSNTDRAALCKELIKYNPSVFNADGTVKQNANFDKLDVPSIDYIKNKYVQNGSIKRNGARTSYTAKSTGEQTETKVSNTQAAAKANKTKAYTATITFNIHTMGLNQGSGEARFTDSTGQTHTFTASTGTSWNATNARKDIAAQIREKIKAAGFTNVTLKNPSNYEF